MRLGFMCDPTNNAYYRVIFPLRALELRGHDVIWPDKLGDDLSMRALSTCDLVLCYRNPHRLADIHRLSERGVAIVFDNDDNYGAAEVSELGGGLKGRRYNQQFANAMLKMALNASYTTTPSPVLAELYQRQGVQNVAVIENHLEGSMVGFGKTAPHDGVVIGWVAAREHSVEVERMPIQRTLAALLEKHPEVRVLTVGIHLPLRSDRYEYIPEVPLPQLLKVIRRIDIGIAPLVDVPFNRSRSNIKLKEYSSGGAAWLASNVGPYRGFGERQGGLVVEDADWPDALERLVTSTRLRRRLSRHSRRWAGQQVITNHAGNWETVFARALAATESS